MRQARGISTRSPTFSERDTPPLMLAAFNSSAPSSQNPYLLACCAEHLASLHLVAHTFGQLLDLIGLANHIQ